MTAASYSRVLGANERVQLGLIGCGGRGTGVMGTFMKTNQVDVTAVCDIYGDRIDRAQQTATNAKDFNDHRKLLDAKNVDAVLIATPDHWHARHRDRRAERGQRRLRRKAADAED